MQETKTIAKKTKRNIKKPIKRLSKGVKQHKKDLHNKMVCKHD